MARNRTRPTARAGSSCRTAPNRRFKSAASVLRQRETVERHPEFRALSFFGINGYENVIFSLFNMPQKGDTQLSFIFRSNVQLTLTKR